MNKIGVKILQICYLIIVVMISLYLVFYNNFGFSTVGNYTIFVANDVAVFDNGTLVVIKKDVEKVNVGDIVLFYDSYNATDKILYEEVLSKETTNEKEETLLLENERFLSSSYLIGRLDDAFEIPLIGYFINILSSAIGYFTFVIAPIAIILIFQLRLLISNVKSKRRIADVGANKTK